MFAHRVCGLRVVPCFNEDVLRSCNVFVVLRDGAIGIFRLLATTERSSSNSENSYLVNSDSEVTGSSLNSSGHFVG